MNRNEFGELLSALRQDLDWTQFQLAEYSGVDEAVISQVERGVRKFFEPELLFRLANVLQLTTLERREFIFAANGLDERQLVRQPSASVKTDTFDPQRMLARLVNLTGEVRLPSFLTDVYGDVIAANRIVLTLYKIPPSLLENADSIPGGYNTMRLNFGKDLVARNQILDNWESYALTSMRSFREHSLRYRAKPYFKYLMKAFRNPVEYPLFDRFWKLVSSMEQDKDINMDHFEYRHVEYGLLRYIASTTVSVTSFGELFLIQYLPLDDRTDQVFTQLKNAAGEGVMRFASWPAKKVV